MSRLLQHVDESNPRIERGGLDLLQKTNEKQNECKVYSRKCFKSISSIPVQLSIPNRERSITH